MRIVSLNVAQLAGKSGFIPLARRNAKHVAPRLAGLLLGEAPDVLALQEAPPPREHFDPVSTLIGDGAEVRIVRHLSPRHGPAILTRRPLLRSGAQLFAETRRDGKGFAFVQVQTNAGPLLIASVHLAILHRPSRRKQIDWLADALSLFDGLKVVVGDLNDGHDAPLYLAQRLGLVPHSAGKTFPSTLPALRLDWAFASREITVRRVDALRHLPSDHCAVRLDLDLEARQ